MKALIALLLLTAGCNRASDRFRAPEEGFEMRKLAGWTDSRESGSVVFRGPADVGLEHNTVVVRAVPKDRVKPHTRTPRGLVRATGSILAGLPNSKVSPVRDVELDGLAGGRFDVSFEPPGKSERYRRTQIALVGDKHIFHLMHTAPEEALAQTAALFDQVVASFEEIVR